jgi:hypothetical protein
MYDKHTGMNLLVALYAVVLRYTGTYIVARITEDQLLITCPGPGSTAKFFLTISFS